MINLKAERRLFLLLLFLGVVVVLPRFWHGAGNNWDGIFPYWREQIPNWLSSLLSSWNQTGLGGPVGYTTGTLASFVYYPLYLLHLPSELVLFSVVAGLLITTSYMSFLLIRREDSNQSFLMAGSLALLTVLNPAIFYKLLAGHLYYLVGYMGFVGILLFLTKARSSWRFAVGLGLLLALSGTQIQFFIFGSLAVLIWGLFNRRAYSWKYYLVALVIALLIHSYWIIGFINGTNSISALSTWAAQNTFEGLATTSLMRVLLLTFSTATFISRIYGNTLLLPGLLLVVALPLMIAFSGKITSRAPYYLVMLVVFAYVATGGFLQFPLPGLGRFYPILREAGHAAPVFVLFLVLAISQVQLDNGKRVFKQGLTLFFVLYALLNATIYYKYIPRVNFSQARSDFSQFYSFNKTDGSSHRELTYPFFNQYSFIDQPQIVRKGTPMSNSGWDSFTIFSGHEYIDNAIPAIPEEFQDSLQYKFVISLDTSILRRYNVKYIYDYSAIYRSNFDKFSDPKVYNSNPLVIRNDADFTKKVLELNPTADQVAPGVIELTDVLPRLFALNSTFTKVSPTEYRLTMSASSPQTISFLSSYHQGWELIPLEPKNAVRCENPIIYANGAKECVGSVGAISGNELNYSSAKAFASSAHQKQDFANSWQISEADWKNLDSKYIDTTGSAKTVTLALYYRPQTPYLLALLMSVLTILCSAVFLVYGRRIRSDIKG